MKRFVLFLAVSLAGLQALQAQVSLVKDINVTGSASGFRIYESIVMNDLIYMIADDSFQKKGLWKSDGTAAGTVLIKEIEGLDPVNLVAANNLLYFVTHDANSIYRLWKSDGTPGGTAPFQPINSRAGDAGAHLAVNVNGTLYYSSDQGLMKTDGTTAGTMLVKSVSWSNLAWISEMINVNGKLFLVIYQNFVPYLYKSDGTPAGTVQIINNTDSGISIISAAGNNLYFRGRFGQGDGLYKASDTGPVTLVKGFAGGVYTFAAVGSTLYFNADDGTNGNELWKTDGSTAGTVLVKNINAGAGASDPSLLTAVGNQLYFVANDGINGRELWKTGGTAATTMLVKDIRPGSVGPDIRELTAVGSKVAFLANDGSGEKLWQSNGVASGTKVLADLLAAGLFTFDNNLYFNGNAGSGLELFKSTMVTGGTSPVTDIAKPESIPLGFTAVNGVSYFAADDGIHGRELWKTDGSPAGTVLVSDAVSGKNGSYPRLITPVNGTVFFAAGNSDQAYSLWKTGGTAATTVKVRDFAKADTLKGLIDVNGTLFFGVVNATGNMQLWKSDGSAAGTQLIRTFAQTSTFAPVTMNGQVYFGAWDGINSVDLWKSNGTAAGTTLVKDIAKNNGRNLYTSITVAGNYVYYLVTDFTSTFRNFLVRTDGTAAGTTTLLDLGYHLSSKLTAVGNLVFFTQFNGSAFDDYPGEILWRTDGTQPGTIPLLTMRTYDYENLLTHDMVAADGVFYFVPHEEEELWKSDGTVEGTRKLTSLDAKAIGGKIRYVTAVGGTVYFAATDGARGRELWRSQGTVESTSLADDITPNGSTLFYGMAALDNQLLISADNGMYGAELFRYQDAGSPAVVRVNAGGQAFAASGARQFGSDQYYSGTTRVSTAASGDIVNTTDDQLYREQRLGQAFSYKIPIPNGTVNVVLHFAEIYWGVPAKTSAPGAGKRRFHVNMEGTRRLTNYDIFTAAGGAMRAKTETFAVNVTDGTLNIDFLSGAADQPIIAAIEVVPPQQVALGIMADAFVRNGPDEAINFGSDRFLEVKSGSRPAYQRKSYLKFSLDGVAQVHSAKLRIYGSNIQSSETGTIAVFGITDDSWQEYNIRWNNAPTSTGGALSTAHVKGTPDFYELDVTSFVQSQLGSDKMVSLLLTNPAEQNLQFSFYSKENAINAPQLLINLADQVAKISTEDKKETVLSDEKTSGVYPNPAGKRFTVNISDKHQGNVQLNLKSLTGSDIPVVAKEPARAGASIAVEMKAAHVPAGIYFMQIRSRAWTETVKVLLAE